MQKRFLSKILIFMIMLYGLTTSAMAAGTLTLSTSEAAAGDTVTASGIFAPDTWVAVKVLDGSGSIVFYDNVKSDMKGAYNCSFKVPAVAGGNLKVVAGYGSNVVSVNLNIRQPHSDNGGSGDDDSSGSSLPAGSTPAAPAYKAEVSGVNASGSSLPVNVNAESGSAAVEFGALAKDIFAGKGKAVLAVPPIPGVNTYTLGIPAASLSGSSGGEGSLVFSTGTGSVAIPAGMLTGIPEMEGKQAGITIGQGGKDGLQDEVKTAIGDRPIVRITLSLGGVRTEWNNPDAPVTISIPYKPTAAELANPESIVIWYIDGSGKAVCVPNGHYDPVTGTVTFKTTHFSRYALGFKNVSFKDVPAGAWYSRAVSFIAARDITSGTANGYFSPNARLNRGDFLVMLMKAYGMEPDASPRDNFSDAGDTYYTGYLAAAKRMGISTGTGNNMYAPGREITRQEMFTLLHNFLKAIGQFPGTYGRARTHGRATAVGSDQPVGEADDQPRGHSGKTLDSFSDAGQISIWAKDAMTQLVASGIVGGSGGRLAPAGTATRAEMAQVLYNLLVK